MMKKNDLKKPVMQMKENDLKKSVMQLLAIYEKQGKLIAIRNNSFAGLVGFGKSNAINLHDATATRWINNRKAGSADIFVFLPGGQTEFWELKAGKNKQSAEQLEFESKVKKLGYTYRIIRNLTEVEKIILGDG